VAYLLPQGIVLSGLSPAYSAVNAGGDTFSPGATSFLHVRNASGVTTTVTIRLAWIVAADLTAGPVTIAIPGGQTRMIGPFPGPLFSNPTTVTCAPVTGVTIAACALGDLGTPGGGGIADQLLPSLTLYPDLTLFPKA
jgi:hypothetical protein